MYQCYSESQTVIRAASFFATSALLILGHCSTLSGVINTT
ncbi:hypothetical protein predicted by Glimmer/Critica [Acetobacter ghanensis]|uniref:Uncharacterized protein n=1 Tax=Acetobacter ghanensis TaxID=431306 RepID=A0A0U5F7H0_9PROT|nr:hypothetical protein predicted by Glimmer/Critica [Acetobacter ghanensis]